MILSEIILKAKEAGFFRAKTFESKTKVFDSLDFGFKTEDEKSGYFDMLMSYDNDQRQKKLARQKMKIEKEQSKKLADAQLTDVQHIQKQDDRYFVLTAAQNNTPVNATFFKSLQKFCNDKKATLLVGKLTYNKNGFAQPEVNNDLWFDPLVVPYLVDQHTQLSEKWHFLAHANIIPTAINPLSGLAGATNNDVNMIVPASKISLECNAALDKLPKIMASTGTVTERNYILRKAGACAITEHNIGAIFVDVKTGDIRQLEQMPGFDGFYYEHDLYSSKGKDKLRVVNCVTAVNLGDIHSEKLSENDLQKVLDFVYYWKPKHIFLHDLLDFSSRNHHNRKDPIFIHNQHILNNTVRGDLQKARNVLEQLQDVCSAATLHIIESNHDQALERWLKETDFKLDPVNATIYLELMRAIYKANEEKVELNLLKHALDIVSDCPTDDQIIFHKVGESCILSDIEFAYHGHQGIKGSKGSPQQFRKLGIRMNTGHAHTPSICGKVYTAGVSVSDRMDYTIGAAENNRVAHIITYCNGQRSIIFGDI